MSIIAPQQDLAAQERTREAWSLYADEVRGLSGSAYENAEHAAWERLRRELDRIAAGLPADDEPSDEGA
ncbi:MAG: hypothetical protein LT070_06340 [Solirubrobacteraceae bacterium]|nr:hypothetical protein [Solirubrobacteraceae bacterium]